MLQQELLIKVIKALDRLGIDYMLTGSIASSLQGEPRSTHDIDFVLTIQKENIPDLVREFPTPNFHLDQESIERAIQTQTVFNLIDVNNGYKADFWILTQDPFDRSRFLRKYTEELFGLKLKVSAPEDTILMKLRWAQLSGGSEKQFIDALRVYEIQSGKLDIAYMEKWARILAVETLWERLKHQAESL